jgi:PKD repeat protein
MGRRALRARSGAVVLFLASLVCAPSLLLMASADAGPARVWFADHKTLKRIDPPTNTVAQSLSVQHQPGALAPDALDGSLWALAHKSLLKLNPAGDLVAELKLQTIAPWLNHPEHLALNPHDGSLWVAGHKGAVRLDRNGKKLAEWQSSSTLRAIALDADDSLWVLTKKELVHLTPQASVKEAVDLQARIRNHRYLAVDGLGGAIWVASAKHVLRFNLFKPTDAPQLVSTAAVSPLDDPEEPDDKDQHEAACDKDHTRIVALGAHPYFGTLWVLTGSSLRLYDRGGTYLRTLGLSAYDLGRLRALAHDALTPALWLAGKQGIARVTDNGEYVTKIGVDKEAQALGVAPFKLQPTLSLIAPADGSRTRNALSLFRLGLGAQCSSVPCTLGETYLRSFTFAADLNGQPVGSLFSINGSEAQFQPASRLPEGQNTFSAKATDLFGHSSEKVTSNFTVDTIPPRFLSIAPADGSAVTSALVTISGSVDDASASVTLLNAAGAAIGLGGPQFGFPVTLASGINVFTLVARDSAGNQASVALRLIRASALSVAVTSIAPDATVSESVLQLSGTYAGPANIGITVNGMVALTFNGEFHVNNLPLQPGWNTLTVVATTPDGQTVTKTLRIYSDRSSRIAATVEPQSGVAPLATRFVLASRLENPVQEIGVDFDGNGTVDFTTSDINAIITHSYTTPGLHRPKITVTDSAGATYSQSLVVLVYDAAQMDVLFRGIWDGMNAALTAGDVATATRHLNKSATTKYKPVFEALLPHMPEIVGSYSPLNRVSISGDIGEYAINRSYQGQRRIYLIYFLKDADGVWRLDAM